MVVALWLFLAGCSTPLTTPTGPCGALDGAACLVKAEARLEEGKRVEGHGMMADACDQHAHGPACAALGKSLLGGGAVDEGTVTAPSGDSSAFGLGLAWYDKACALKEGEACYEVGRLHLRGIGIPKNETKAIEWFDKACRAKHSEGCVDAGILHETGKGGTAAPKEAVERYRTACTLKNGRGCTKLGLAFRGGTGVDANPAAAIEALERGCGLGFAAGCGLAALTLEGDFGVPPDPARRLVMLKEATRLGDRFAATKLDDLVARGEVPEGSIGMLTDDLAPACTEGGAQACLVAGRLALGATQRDAAVTAWQKGCAKGSNRACAALALEDADAVVAAGGAEALAVLHERGCSAAVADSCLWLGKAYETGEGVEIVDLDDALKAYAMACSKGVEAACVGKARVQALR